MNMRPFESAHGDHVLAHTDNVNGRTDSLKQMLTRVCVVVGTVLVCMHALKTASSRLADTRAGPRAALHARLCAGPASRRQHPSRSLSLSRAAVVAPTWELYGRVAARGPEFDLDSTLGIELRRIGRQPLSVIWNDAPGGQQSLFLDRFFDARGFEAWDAVRVTRVGATRASLGRRISTPTTRAAKSQGTTPGSSGNDRGRLHVAQLLLLFRYRNQGAVPHGAPPPIMMGPASHDLAVVQWLVTNAVDTAYAAAHNGTRTFEVRRPRGQALVPVWWLVQSRLVVPCGAHSRLAGAFWVWDECSVAGEASRGTAAGLLACHRCVLPAAAATGEAWGVSSDRIVIDGWTLARARCRACRQRQSGPGATG